MDDDPLAGLRLLARFRLPLAIALSTLAYGTLDYALLEGAASETRGGGGRAPRLRRTRES